MRQPIALAAVLASNALERAGEEKASEA